MRNTQGIVNTFQKYVTVNCIPRSKNWMNLTNNLFLFFESVLSDLGVHSCREVAILEKESYDFQQRP